MYFWKIRFVYRKKAYLPGIMKILGLSVKHHAWTQGEVLELKPSEISACSE